MASSSFTIRLDPADALHLAAEAGIPCPLSTPYPKEIALGVFWEQFSPRNVTTHTRRTATADGEPSAQAHAFLCDILHSINQYDSRLFARLDGNDEVGKRQLLQAIKKEAAARKPAEEARAISAAPHDSHESCYETLYRRYRENQLSEPEAAWMLHQSGFGIIKADNKPGYQLVDTGRELAADGKLFPDAYAMIEHVANYIEATADYRIGKESLAQIRGDASSVFQPQDAETNVDEAGVKPR